MFNDNKPTIMEVRQARKPGFAAEVRLRAFGLPVSILLRPHTMRAYQNDFSPLAHSIFRDAADGYPICVPEPVKLWKPHDTSFVPSPDARVQLSRAKELNLVQQFDLREKFNELCLQFPLVRNLRELGIEPDGKDTYLVQDYADWYHQPSRWVLVMNEMQPRAMVASPN